MILNFSEFDFIISSLRCNLYAVWCHFLLGAEDEYEYGANLTLARAGGGVDAPPMSFSRMAAEPLGGSR